MTKQAKGLRQMVADALGSDRKPVNISGEATAALARLAREWSGVRDAKFRLGVPTGSPYASWEGNTREFTINADELLLNPHRVLFTVTPFRLKQEAFLTGALLHEAGHARFSRWKPGGVCVSHSDGTTPTKATIELAATMEEARVEGWMARNADAFGAAGLGWTMRAMAAHFIPVTDMSRDPNQAMMDFLTSWALRAGRQIALSMQTTGYTTPGWVRAFDEALIEAMTTHLLAGGESDPDRVAKRVYGWLTSMLTSGDHTGPAMIDLARDVLADLFPETPEDEMPEAGGGCSAAEGEGEESEDGESGAEGATSSTEDEESEGEPEEGDSDEGSDADQSDSDGEGEVDDEIERMLDGEDDEGDEEPEDSGDENPMAQVLAAMEAAADDASEEMADEEMEAANGAGTGVPTDTDTSGWRTPTKVEREIAGGAEKFLRKLIAPTESSRTMLTEAPSANIDPSAHAAWKAGGMVRDPRFFRRTARFVESSPPVKIAVLVDISGSMDQLQKPSAVLSWALSSAALDLRNFAGRGTQVESCLIHWGDEAHVVQANGETLPGIREYGCYQGTSAMDQACALVEEQMPGFFDLPQDGRPENRLLVQFTDWELNNPRQAGEWIKRAMEAGVNMLSVVPGNYNDNLTDSYSSLPAIKRMCKVQRGVMSLLKYDWRKPGEVWEHAAKTLISV